MTSEEFVKLDKAIDKVLDSSTVDEGRQELEALMQQGITDDALFFWRADSNYQEYLKTGDKSKLQKAIDDYRRLVAKGDYEHLKATLRQWETLI